MRNLKLISIGILLALLHCSCRKGGIGSAGWLGTPSAPAGTPTNPPATGNGVHSSWYLTGSGWDTTGAINYDAVAFYNITAPDITQAVIDSEQVRAYMKGGDSTALGNHVFPLPHLMGSGFGFSDL